MLRVTEPITLTDAELESTDLAENDYPVWDAGTTYGLGDRCIKSHGIWESMQNSNTGRDPETEGPAWWVRVGPTNRWAAFQLDQTTATAQANDFYYQFSGVRAFNALHLVGLIDISSVRVIVAKSDNTVVFDSDNQAIGRVIRRASWHAFFFGPRKLVTQVSYLSIPFTDDCRVRLEFTGGVDAAVQAIIMGQMREYGRGVLVGVRAGFENYSRVVRDEWGGVRLTKGNYSRRISFTAHIGADEFDEFNEFVADHYSDVLYWTVSDKWRATQILGFVKSADPLIQYPKWVDYAIELEGMAIS